VATTPLKFVEFNSNGFIRQFSELSKQLQDLHVDIALFSETHLKPHERLFITNYHYYQTDRHPVRKGDPHSYLDLRPSVSVQATGVCIHIGNSEILLAFV
jgi:hypothetical protein